MVMYGHLWPCIVMYGNGHVLSCMGLKGIERRSCVNSYEFVCLMQLCMIHACLQKTSAPIELNMEKSKIQKNDPP